MHGRTTANKWGSIGALALWTALAALPFAAGCDGGSPDTIDGDPSAPAASGTVGSPDASPVAPDASPSSDAAPASAADASRPADARADAADASASPPASGADASSPAVDGGDPCDGVVCPAGQACVSSAHGQPLGVCVDTCDCSNCSNCDYTAQDGRWNDMQEYCGNLNNQPATMKCNVPCKGAGEGCIYYGAVNICWPLEGCFSM